MAPCARGWAGTLLPLLLATRAAAQPAPCGDLAARENDEVDVRPPDRAEGVARNAAVVVRHPDGDELAALLRELRAGSDGDACSRAPICLFRDASERGGDAREPVSGRVVELDARTLAFVPDARLASESDYIPVIARSGFDQAARTELEFTTSEDVDREPPEFDPPPEEIRIEIDRPPVECGAPDGTFRVQLAVPRADDDGDEESVELLLFVTEAEGLRGPTLRARRFQDAEGEVVLTFLLAAREAERPVCVALRAIDGVGRSSEGEPELCFDPLQASHFEPLCSARTPGRTHGGPGSLVPLATWLWVVLRRRRRRRLGRAPATDATP